MGGWGAFYLDNNPKEGQQKKFFRPTQKFKGGDHQKADLKRPKKKGGQKLIFFY